MITTALIRVLCIAGVGALLLVPAAQMAGQTPAPCEGFGASTPGGSGKPVYHVTNLNNSGPGSLRDALSQGNRTVVFDVGGDVVLSDEITLRSSFVTVDGFTAPFPGITLKNFGLIIRGTAGHDVIVRGIRVRDAFQDGIWVTDAAYNVVIDHVSIQNSGDGNLDITRLGTRDITVCWSILAEPAGEEKNMLLAFRQSRITLHHNLFIDSAQRSPQVTFDDSADRAQDTGTTLDMRNNLIWNWRGGYGSRIRYGGQANVVDNFYAADGGDASDALIVCKGLAVDSQCYDDVTNVARAYVSGNISADGVNLNNRGTQAAPFPAPPVTTQDPRVAACQVRDGAGARPLDTIDERYVSTISLLSCTPPPPCTHVNPLVSVTPAAPAGVAAGTAVIYTVSVTNKDTSPCTTSTFNPAATVPSGWAKTFGSSSLPIAPGASASTSLQVTSPSSAANGTYSIAGSVTNAAAPSATSHFAASYTVANGGGGTGSFSDNFNRADSTSLGSGWTEVSGDLVVKGNALKNALGAASHKAVVSSLSGATQTISADFMSQNNNQGPVFGLLLRYQNPTNYYAAYRQVGGTAVLRIARVVNGTATVLASVAQANPAVNVPFKLTARVSGKTISLDLNGVNRLNVTEPTSTFSTGKVGIQINSSSTTTQYQADNFTASAQ